MKTHKPQVTRGWPGSLFRGMLRHGSIHAFHWRRPASWIVRKMCCEISILLFRNPYHFHLFNLPPCPPPLPHASLPGRLPRLEVSLLGDSSSISGRPAPSSTALPRRTSFSRSALAPPPPQQQHLGSSPPPLLSSPLLSSRLLFSSLLSSFLLLRVFLSSPSTRFPSPPFHLPSSIIGFDLPALIHILASLPRFSCPSPSTSTLTSFFASTQHSRHPPLTFPTTTAAPEGNATDSL